MKGHRVTNFHSYAPSDGHRLAHDPLNAIVGPRPIGWISSESLDGVRNLAPYSFFNAFNYRPPIIGFSSIGWKDSVANISAIGEFGWNLATRPLAAPMNASAATAAASVDEFDLAGLTPTPSQAIRPPRVLESPVSFECRLSQLIQLVDSHQHDIESWLVLGEVVMIHIDEALLVDGVYDTAAAAPILRGGGPADYFSIGAAQRFQMVRPP